MPVNDPNIPANPFRDGDVRRRFDRAADGFADVDFVHRRSFDSLLERLQPMRIRPRRILDLGSAAGAGSRRLARAFRSARVTGLDLSRRMLAVARERRSRFVKISELQANAMALPFRTGVFDLVIANQLLPWIGDLRGFFGGVARVLRKDGLLMFATLGPDSLIELRVAWQEEDRFEHVNPFVDMHDVGDALVRAGLRDPVLDVERLTVSYRDPASLFADLTATGARNCLRGRRPTLTGKARFRRVVDRLENEAGDDGASISLELVFGHAWGGGPPTAPGEYRIDAGSIGRFRR